MRLSEAIRAGAKIRPQAYGDLYVERHKLTWRCLFGKCVKVRTSCALGAAFEVGDCGQREEVATKTNRGFRGVVQEGQKFVVIETPTEWTAVLYTAADCPQCERQEPLKTLIPHLNDDHKWTREEIAVFVERVETAREPSQIPTAQPAEVVEWPEVVG